MNFSEAINNLKQGHTVCREGWNGKDMFLTLVQVDAMRGSKVPEKGAKIDHCIAMYTAQKTWQPGWLASQADMLANDWMISD